MKTKIRTTHLERKAVVYLRQSTLRQVVEHRESTARQYDLRGRAQALGWPPEQVVVIDEDLGRSGSSSAMRLGFQRLADDVAHGRVGAIFALEASRLARRSADWHRLLDLCRLADVVIADEEAVYAPRDYDDQLLLGLKGTMAEAETVWMRRRLQGGKLSKAHRGELYQQPPIGYVWDRARRRFDFDPDEQVQRAVRLVFERFRVDGSARGVVRYFARHRLKVPVSDRTASRTRSRVPNPSTVLGMLHNPVYAGAYVYGRTEERTALVGGELRQRQVTRLPREAWKVTLPDRHPGYISWEEFMTNQRKLHENRTNHKMADQRGASREGSALLQGLVLCGRCGCRMSVRYQRQGGGRPTYKCGGRDWRSGEGGGCWSVSSATVDAPVERLFLEAVQPSEVELSLAILHEAERQATDLERQWQLRLERLEYDARLAERRYMAVDPDNRVVARTLERHWEERLRELEAAQREHAEALERERIDLSGADRKRILSLACELPRIWRAPTTTHAERKNMLRLVIREVALSPVDVPKHSVRIRVLWQTNAVTDFVVARRSSTSHFATPAKATDLIRKGFAEGQSDHAIAVELDRRGLRTGRGRAWDAAGVARARRRVGLLRPKGPPAARRRDGLYSAHGVAARLDVCVDTVRRWVQLGWLEPVEVGGPGRPSWYRLDDSTLERVDALRRRSHS